EFRKRLVAWNDAFERVTGKKALVQPPTSAAPVTTPSTGGIPGWVIFVGGVAAAGVAAWLGDSAYLAFQEAKAKKKSLEKELIPRILSAPRLSPRLPSSPRVRADQVARRMATRHSQRPSFNEYDDDSSGDLEFTSDSDGSEGGYDE